MQRKSPIPSIPQVDQRTDVDFSTPNVKSSSTVLAGNLLHSGLNIASASSPNLRSKPIGQQLRNVILQVKSTPDIPSFAQNQSNFAHFQERQYRHTVLHHSSYTQGTLPNAHYTPNLYQPTTTPTVLIPAVQLLPARPASVPQYRTRRHKDRTSHTHQRSKSHASTSSHRHTTESNSTRSIRQSTRVYSSQPHIIFRANSPDKEEYFWDPRGKSLHETESEISSLFDSESDTCALNFSNMDYSVPTEPSSDILSKTVTLLETVTRKLQRTQSWEKSLWGLGAYSSDLEEESVHETGKE